MVDVLGRAHNGQAVAVLQPDVVGGKQLYVAPLYAAHVHAVCGAQVQLPEVLAVKHAPRHHDDAALHMGVYGVPVYFLLVPVGFNLLAEENLERLYLVGHGHNEHVVVDAQLGACQRHYDFTASPDARHDELDMRLLRHLGKGLAVERGIYHHKLRHVGLVFLHAYARLQVGRLHKELPYKYHCHDYADHAQRISDGAAQGGSSAGLSRGL